MSQVPSDNQTKIFSRREWMATVLMGISLVLSYGMLAIQGLLFLLPTRVRPPTRKLFAGQINQYKVGNVQTFFDLQGKQILLRRDQEGLQAFDSTCPHLGCQVHWESDKSRFFCPCHKGVFDSNGVAIEGPPFAAGQVLARVPLELNEKTGVVYIEVKDIRKTTG